MKKKYLVNRPIAQFFGFLIAASEWEREKQKTRVTLGFRRTQWFWDQVSGTRVEFTNLQKPIHFYQPEVQRPYSQTSSPNSYSSNSLLFHKGGSLQDGAHDSNRLSVDSQHAELASEDGLLRLEGSRFTGNSVGFRQFWRSNTGELPRCPETSQPWLFDCIRDLHPRRS